MVTFFFFLFFGGALVIYHTYPSTMTQRRGWKGGKEERRKKDKIESQQNISTKSGTIPNLVVRELLSIVLSYHILRSRNQERRKEERLSVIDDFRNEENRSRSEFLTRFKVFL
jgi:hypothetical protein